MCSRTLYLKPERCHIFKSIGYDFPPLHPNLSYNGAINVQILTNWLSRIPDVHYRPYISPPLFPIFSKIYPISRITIHTHHIHTTYTRTTRLHTYHTYRHTHHTRTPHHTTTHTLTIGTMFENKVLLGFRGKKLLENGKSYITLSYMHCILHLT